MCDIRHGAVRYRDVSYTTPNQPPNTKSCLSSPWHRFRKFAISMDMPHFLHLHQRKEILRLMYAGSLWMVLKKHRDNTNTKKAHRQTVCALDLLVLILYNIFIVTLLPLPPNRNSIISTIHPLRKRREQRCKRNTLCLIHIPLICCIAS